MFRCVRRIKIESVAGNLLSLLDRSNDVIWYSRTESANRYTIRGVPGRLIDLTISRRWEEVDPRTIRVVEIGWKTGRYDGSERRTINLRRWPAVQKVWSDANNDHQPLLEGGRFEILLSPETAIVRISWEGDEWLESFPRLKSDLIGYDLPSIVIWQWRRYYQHLEFAAARSIADSFAIQLAAEYPDNTASLSEANRLASRLLYAESRALGWRKLTARERTKLGIDKQWCRAEECVRGSTSGGNASGAGDYSERAASAIATYPIPSELSEFVE